MARVITCEPFGERRLGYRRLTARRATRVSRRKRKTSLITPRHSTDTVTKTLGCDGSRMGVATTRTEAIAAVCDESNKS